MGSGSIFWVQFCFPTKRYINLPQNPIKSVFRKSMHRPCECKEQVPISQFCLFCSIKGLVWGLGVLVPPTLFSFALFLLFLFFSRMLFLTLRLVVYLVFLVRRIGSGRANHQDHSPCVYAFAEDFVLASFSLWHALLALSWLHAWPPGACCNIVTMGQAIQHLLVWTGRLIADFLCK